jgi:16S rRNA (cytosine967-C5)-methyltransferase
MRPGALALRLREQAEALDSAAALVKPGGRIAYITCSLLAEENDDQVRAFVARQLQFTVLPPAQAIEPLGERGPAFGGAVLLTPEGLLMTPRRTDTDGFYVSVIRRAG